MKNNEMITRKKQVLKVPQKNRTQKTRETTKTIKTIIPDVNRTVFFKGKPFFLTERKRLSVL